ncbi:hypothetical protein D9757_003943 [Collybiopsis confluens]|uniref:Aminoglycoside phosphotransferase domain-containing protein n=1 Tax=Collybiopsis confluens TaxID=2823264 RepID=A0A8H5HWN4_9AGAR|nr:hypothetical protein D9757_003943 [Collybiopsis confluens]
MPAEDEGAVDSDDDDCSEEGSGKAMAITLDVAQRLVDNAFPDDNTTYSLCHTFSMVHSGILYTRGHGSFIIDLSSSHTAFITIADSQALSTTNSIQVIHQLITLIHDHTSLPTPRPILDTSLTLIPHPYILTPPQPFPSSAIITLSKARSQHLLTPNQNAFIDLRVGQILGQLHSRVQNDWYGRPSTTQPTDPSYSWQETFIALLEPLLERAQEAQIDLGVSYEDIHKFLSRAIAFFLFDDVQVPSLVWFTGSEQDIYISFSSLDSVQIVIVLPTFAQSLWGDPLLETLFLPPAPSEAVREGYEASGGEPLLVFGRQKTKRVWYTVFLALVIITERENLEEDDQRTWALETLNRCAKALKDAPCY